MESISYRYAKGIFESTNDQKSSKKILDDFVLIKNIYKSDDALKNLSQDPNIDLKNKKEIFSKSFKSIISDETLNICNYLFDKKRFEIIYEISDKYLEIYNFKNNLMDIKVIFNVKPKQSQLETIKTKLKTKLNKKIELQVEIDPKILGGVILKINDQIIDGSIKRQLEILKSKI